MILHFGSGPMSWEAAEHNLRLFAAQVTRNSRARMSSQRLADCVGMRETGRLRSSEARETQPSLPALGVSAYCAWAARIAIALGATSCVTVRRWESVIHGGNTQDAQRG